MVCKTNNLLTISQVDSLKNTLYRMTRETHKLLQLTITRNKRIIYTYGYSKIRMLHLIEYNTNKKKTTSSGKTWWLVNEL